VPRTVCRPVVATVPVVVTAMSPVIVRIGDHQVAGDVERSLRPSRIGGGVDGGDQRAHSISGAGGVSEALATRVMVKLPLVIACVKPVPGMAEPTSWLVLGAVAVWFAAV